MPTSVDIKNLKINKLTEAQYDTAVQGGVIGENELSVLTDAELEQIQVSTLPTASADELGNIYQYVGTTDANHTNGYFYKCEGAGDPVVYSWAQVNVQPGSALAAGTGIDITNNTVSVASPTLVNSADLTNHPDDLIIASGSKTITRGYGDRNYLIGDKITIGTTGSAANTIAIGYRINYNNYGYTRGVLISPEGIGKGSDSSVIISSKGTAGLTSGRAGGIMITTGINAEIGPNKGAFSVLISSHGYSAKINADYTTFINNGGNSTITEDNTFWWGNYINTYKLVDSDGTIPSDRLVHAINKYSTMPTAAAGNLGWIVQFTGTTDSTYTHGHLYECVSDGADPATYSWEEVQLGGSGLPDQTGQSGKFLTTDGTDASWSDKPLVNNATSNQPNSLCIGGVGGSWDSARVVSVGFTAQGGTDSVVIGYGAAVGDRGVAIGRGSSTSGGVAIGYNAQNTNSGNAGTTAIGANATVSTNRGIQIGGNSSASNCTNSEWGTLKICLGNDNYKMLDSDGTIPTDRFTTTPVTDGTYVPTLTIASGVATRTWGAAPSAPVVPSTMPELTVAGWSSNTQTVSVTGVTASNIVIVSPAPASAADYAAAGIVCTAQGTDSLTFSCTTVPSNAITVNVIIMG